MYFGGRETETGGREVEMQEVERQTDKTLVRKIGLKAQIKC